MSVTPLIFESIITLYSPKVLQLQYSITDNAKYEGEKLVNTLRVFMASEMIGFEITSGFEILDHKVPLGMRECEFYPQGLEAIRQQLIKEKKITTERVDEDTLGLAVYEVENSLDEIHFVVQERIIKVCEKLKLEYNEYNWNEDEVATSYSLLNTSELVNDRRIRFLLKVMALETLVAPKEKVEASYIDAINNISKKIEELDCDTDTKIRLKSDIGRIKIKTVSEKCRALVEKYCSDKVYGGTESSQLWRECYSLRSKFVHAGGIDMDALDKYCLNLHRMVFDILQAYQRDLNSKIPPTT